MDSTMMPQSTAQTPGYYAKNATKKANYAQQKLNVYPAVPTLPSSPMYSRPGSSCSQQPAAYGNVSNLMTPTASPPASHKPAVWLDSEFGDNSYFPSTPPLSTSGSAIGSPKSCDVLQTPLNPMFSGLDGFQAVKAAFEPVEPSVLDWSSCDSPPMTPMYIQYLPSRVPSLSSTTSDLSATSCPSLSPSPAPYARSVTSESDVDFCDPRNLTVSATSNPTLAPEFTVTSLGEEIKPSTLDTAVLSRPTFDFNPAIANGLPAFEELSEFDSEDDFSNLVTLDDSKSSDISRPRAGTGSSVVSLGHGSFIGDEDFGFDDEEAFQFPSLPSPPTSVDSTEDTHKDKRQKKNNNNKKVNRTIEPVMAAATAETEPTEPIEPSDNDSGEDSGPNSPSESDGTSNPVAAPTNRRGRKQSLTEDPSKTFVCDLCNRRFRRQEHLKRHYRSLHTQEKPFECNECGKKFSRSDNLAQHARTHASGGAIVMDLIENGDASAYEGGMVSTPAADDYNNYGKVLFQIASEVPGSSSELSSGETSDNGKKKRKRSD